MLKAIQIASLVLAATAGPAHAAGPVWLDGTWVGTAYEPPTRLAFSFQVFADSATRTYTFESSTLGCTGTWALLSFSSTKATFNQTVTSGPCRSGVRIVMTQVGSVYASYTAFLPDIRPDNFSTLTRVSR
jgi:hypothetical protein